MSTGSLRIIECYETIGDIAHGLGIPVSCICDKPDAEHIKVVEFLANPHLSQELSLTVIKEALMIGIRHFKISGGGEPLCIPDYTLALMEAMISGDASVELITNGTLLDAHVNEIIKGGLHVLSISIDAATPDVLDRRRGKKGTFDRIKKTLEKINIMKKEDGLIFPKVHIYSVLDEESATHIKGLLRFAEENNIESIHFILRKDRETFFLDEPGSIAQIIKGSPVTTNLNEVLSIAYREKVEQRRVCPFPFNNMVIHANGLVSPCCSMKWGMGEFIQDSSLENIWQSSFFEETRDAFRTGKTPAYCINCKEYMNG